MADAAADSAALMALRLGLFPPLGDPDRHTPVEPLAQRVAELGDVRQPDVRIGDALVRAEAVQARVGVGRPGGERQLRVGD